MCRLLEKYNLMCIRLVEILKQIREQSEDTECTVHNWQYIGMHHEYRCFSCGKRIPAWEMQYIRQNYPNLAARLGR